MSFLLHKNRVAFPASHVNFSLRWFSGLHPQELGEEMIPKLRSFICMLVYLTQLSWFKHHLVMKKQLYRFIFIINSLETHTHLPRRMDTCRWVDLRVDLRLCKLRYARWTSVVEGVGGGGYCGGRRRCATWI